LNAPDDDLERHAADKPLPEPEVISHVLVDAETEATPRRRTSKVMIAALVLTGLGVWQIIHVSNGGEPLFQSAANAISQPTKLRSAGRVPHGIVLQSADPITAYVERGKRGMTDQEIRWMIEDFQAAGLDEKDDLQYGTLRAKQQLWYLQALVEGLQLEPDQKAQAKAKMYLFLAKNIEGLNTIKEFKLPNLIELDVSGFILVSPSYPLWLTMSDTFSPWRLVDLTKEQSALTLRKWVTSPNGELLPTDDPFEDSQETIRWIESKTVVIQDPFNGNLTEFPDPNPDTITTVLSSNRFYGILPISNLFPLIPDQKLADYREDFLSQARILQPAQLRMALLLDSGMALQILKALDQASGVTASDHSANPTSALRLNPINPETPVDPLLEPDSK
jgi:hypothetical protein